MSKNQGPCIDCGQRPQHSRHLCSSCYQRQRRDGTFAPTPRTRTGIDVWEALFAGCRKPTNWVNTVKQQSQESTDPDDLSYLDEELLDDYPELKGRR